MNSAFNMVTNLFGGNQSNQQKGQKGEQPAKYREFMALYAIKRSDNSLTKLGISRLLKSEAEFNITYTNKKFDAFMYVDFTTPEEQKEGYNYRATLNINHTRHRHPYIEVKSFPLKKNEIPNKNNIRAFCEIMKSITDKLTSGKNVLIISGNGYGRAAMAASCVLATMYPACGYDKVKDAVNNMQTKRLNYDEKLSKVKNEKVEEFIKEYCAYMLKLHEKEKEKKSKEEQQKKENALKKEKNEQCAEEILKKYIQPEMLIVRRGENGNILNKPLSVQIV